jgi:hypothetical protein
MRSGPGPTFVRFENGWTPNLQGKVSLDRRHLTGPDGAFLLSHVTQISFRSFIISVLEPACAGLPFLVLFWIRENE